MIFASWQESYEKPRQCVENQRYYFANEVPHSQGYGLPSGQNGCESWTIKKAEHQKIDAFELWCLRRLLRVLWTTRRSNQSILKEINTKFLLEGLMLKLKLQYFGHLMQRANSLEKTLVQGKTEGKRMGWQRTRCLEGITYSMDMSLSKLQEIMEDSDVWHAAIYGVSKTGTWLRSWTTTTTTILQKIGSELKNLPNGFPGIPNRYSNISIGKVCNNWWELILPLSVRV